MKKLYFSTLLCLLTIALTGQSRWSWGAELQIGQAGERVDENREYGNVGLAYGNTKTYSTFSPSITGGLWIDYQLGVRWSVQSGLRFRQLNRSVSEKSFNYDASNLLTRYNYTTNTLRQQSIEVPLQMRYYLTLPTHSLRPYLGVQVASAYLVSGEQLNVQEYNDLIQDQTDISAQRHELDFSQDYIKAQPWQVTYGAEVGVEWKQYALSLTHNRTFRADRLDHATNPYFYICCFGDCGNFYDDYNPYYQTRILRNTNLRLQYQF